MLSAFALLSLLLAFPGVAAAEQSGAQTVTVNGVPMLIRVVEVNGAPSTVATRLLARWRGDPAVRWTHHERLRQRTIVAQQRGPLYVSASLAPGRRPSETRVVISVLDPRAAPHPVQVPFAPQPERSVWVSAVTSDSGIGEFLGYTAMPLPQARKAWSVALRRAGYAVRVAPGGQLEAHGYGQTVGVFLRGSHAGTAVVVQRTGTPGVRQGAQ